MYSGWQAIPKRFMMTVLAICLGASIGALARWQLGLWLNPAPAQVWAELSWGTISANWIGAYLIGVCIAIFEIWPELNPHWRPLLITGFLGALTTFSTFSAEVVLMLQQQRYSLALGSAALHLFGSLGLTLAGMHSVEMVWGWVRSST
jgi:CrcB protein